LRPARSHRGSADPFELSADEYAVAHLVAAGRSNRETAAQLYLSVKTVEYHLAKIYTKLAISSRRQLASRLNPPPPHPDDPERIGPARTARARPGQD
jgi:DNA-binding CsgD family transcriptional regulator